jgi:hypothetical protein
MPRPFPIIVDMAETRLAVSPYREAFQRGDCRWGGGDDGGICQGLFHVGGKSRDIDICYDKRALWVVVTSGVDNPQDTLSGVKGVGVIIDTPRGGSVLWFHR